MLFRSGIFILWVAYLLADFRGRFAGPCSECSFDSFLFAVVGSAVNQRVRLDDGQNSVDSSCLLSGVILTRVVESF